MGSFITTGVNQDHGTHIAGIIGAIHNNISTAGRGSGEQVASVPRLTDYGRYRAAFEGGEKPRNA